MTTPSNDKPLDEFGVMAKERLLAQVEQYNALASRVKAAEGDPQALLENLRESYTEDEQVAKITAAIEDLDNKREALFNKRDSLLKPVVEKMVEEAKSGLGDAEQQAQEIAKVIKSARNYIETTYGPSHLEDVPALVGKRRAGGGGGGGTGARRVRGYDVYVDGTLATAPDAQGNKKSNLAAAAKALGVDTEDLRNLFFQAAGSDDSKSWGNTVEFDVTVTEDGKESVKHLVCKRQVTATPGAPAVSEGSTAA